MNQFLELKLPKGPGKRGYIVAHDVSWAEQTGKHLLRTQNVSEQNQKHFLCPGHKICVRNKCCTRRQTGKHLCRQQCVGNNVSSFARALMSSSKCPAVLNEERENKREKKEKNKTKQRKSSYFLPMCSAVSLEHLPLSSSVVSGRRHKLSLRCLRVLKYALEVESDSSAPEGTGREKKMIS